MATIELYGFDMHLKDYLSIVVTMKALFLKTVPEHD